MDTSTIATPDRELDARGLNCPLPILRAKKALNDMSAGQVLRILATDPGSVRDFQAFARQTGHQLLFSGETAGEFVFLLKKK
jgi:tRNA 2-thiouridine synthesizing protein A